MLIGKLAKMTQVSHDTIRYYESLGLLDAPLRPNRFNNYKDYPESNVARIGTIRELQSFGFKLSEIVAFLKKSRQEHFTCNSAGDILENKVKVFDTDISKLEMQRSALIAALHKIRENPEVRREL